MSDEHPGLSQYTHFSSFRANGIPDDVDMPRYVMMPERYEYIGDVEASKRAYEKKQLKWWSENESRRHPEQCLKNNQSAGPSLGRGS